MKHLRRRPTTILVLSLIALGFLWSYVPAAPAIITETVQTVSMVPEQTSSIRQISDEIGTEDVNSFDFPVYNGEEVICLNNNLPSIQESDLVTEDYISLCDLDALGRCGPATACIGLQLLATEPRGSIGMIKPSGWHTIRYEFVDGKYLYNRCHLVAYQLCGVNSDERNLITGTRYLNLEGMLTLENQVYSYVVSTGNHVFYRVTPRFIGENLLATGVEIEGLAKINIGIPVADAFRVSIQGALLAEKYGTKKAIETAFVLSQEIKELDVVSIVNACKLVKYEVWYRNPFDALMSEYIESIPNKATIRNIQILVRRCLLFFEKYGQPKCYDFSFEPVDYLSCPYEYALCFSLIGYLTIYSACNSVFRRFSRRGMSCWIRSRRFMRRRRGLI